MPFALGAEIEGIVYTTFLEPATGAIVTIDTAPQQTKVATEGSYKFTVPNGVYTITATATVLGEPYETAEKVTIKSEGAFVIDLILIPTLDDSGDIDNDLSLEDTKGIHAPAVNNVLLTLTLVIFAGVLIILLFGMKIAKEHHEHHLEEAKEPLQESAEDPDKHSVYSLLQQQGGRMTQKDIRKNLPLSEAKISLIIAELEHDGKVKKIKKGRGNIIVLI